MGVTGVATLGDGAGLFGAGTGGGATLGGGAGAGWEEGGWSASWKMVDRSRRARMWGSVGAKGPAGVGFMMA